MGQNSAHLLACLGADILKNYAHAHMLQFLKLWSPSSLFCHLLDLNDRFYNSICNIESCKDEIAKLLCNQFQKYK